MHAKTTISDIARALKITPATVSRALNNHPAISGETKRLVQQTAEKLHYSRNKIASSLRLGKTFVVGIIIPSANINFFGSVVHGIESLANQHNYSVLIYQSNEAVEFEQKGIEAFIGARVDGILASIAKSTTDLSHYEAIARRNIPLVFFDRALDNMTVPSVMIDDYKGGYLATEHLIKQGYTRIAHIMGQQHLTIFRDRLNGYLAALKHYGLPADESLLFQGNVSIESGREAITHFLQLPQPPDAVFAVEDFTALGVIKELKRRKVKVPGEIGVIGFANEGFGEHITPSLSSIDQQTVQMGEEAFKLLYELMSKPESKTVKSKVILEPVPVFRASSQKDYPVE
ncbi:LacI family DNA-binding transcriptional regulator [Deminuibacter soli]|uniref:LacI family transcriptional regulator n=1 Tax=Deminuibacter soli TaxID=2291815 RepID=A0A3E1NLM1_9BACT|nr:LacI family DNA-binding transcriptional regulator [Deminuibacter soli]RFM28840.1 LacI family transcriptional regulator [Deminuibacter soli]